MEYCVGVSKETFFLKFYTVVNEFLKKLTSRTGGLQFFVGVSAWVANGVTPYTHESLGECVYEENTSTSGISTVSHEKALYN